MKRQIIHLQDESDLLVAYPSKVEQGLMVNVPVTAIFPDGRKFDTVMGKLTEKGLAEVERQMKAEGML
jgi:hypothetical protein